MRITLALALAICLYGSLTYAEEAAPSKPAEHTWLTPSMSLGISYPLVVSASIGAIVPLGASPNNPHNDLFPSIPALRFDEEIGLGGTTTAIGLVLPRENGMLSLKKARLRTWFMPWNIERGKIFDGTVIEASVMAHIPVKLGLGRFTEVDPPDGSPTSLTYVFLGVGW
ncbi:MAG TPA: hypothetical protein VFR06_00305 [Gallionellaceae bacterium]|nr:hypothetical protein [Gallionellaceae bacterium]